MKGLEEAFVEAVAAGSLVRAQNFYDEGARDTLSALFAVVHRNELTDKDQMCVVGWLLDKGVGNINDRPAIGDTGKSILTESLASFNPALFRALLEAGADPLWYSKNSEPPVRELLNMSRGAVFELEQNARLSRFVPEILKATKNALLNLEPRQLKARYLQYVKDGALIAAILYRGRESDCDAGDLLFLGASPNARHGRKTALSVAATRKKDIEAVRTLLDAGANPLCWMGVKPQEYNFAWGALLNLVGDNPVSEKIINEVRLRWPSKPSYMLQMAARRLLQKTH